MDDFSLPHLHEKHGDLKDLHKKLKQKEGFQAASDLFKQLSDPTRMRIFWLLSHREECVINIAAWMDTSSPAVSHHLRSLYDCGLITSRRDGREVYYKAAETEQSKLFHKAIEKAMEITCPRELTALGGSAEDVIAPVHTYLVEHLSERITIEELSRKFLMNPTTLKNKFKEVYGVSLANHIRRHRMERAAELLKSTDKSIAQIAGEIGYDSQSRFTAAFKTEYGLLPREYRKK